MKPVFARHLCYRGDVQPVDGRMVDGPSRIDVPPQPPGCKPAPFGLGGGNEIDRVSRKIHNGLLLRGLSLPQTT